MASLGKLGNLTDAQYADLEARVDQFHAAWTPDTALNLDAFLPPPGAPHRPFVLVEMLKTDMERRVRAGMPIRVEPYLARFPKDIPPGAVPISLVAEEYQLRHRYADRPSFDEYRGRFPTIAEALGAHLRITPTHLPASIRPSYSGDADEITELTSEAAAEPAVTQVTPLAGFKKSTRASRNPDPEVAAADILPADVEYKLLRRLGKGTFGEVYEALAPGGFRVAVKRILRAVDHPSSQGEVEALEAMKAMSHPFLVQTHAYWVFRDRLVIVMELAEGSLAGRMEHYAGQGLTGVPTSELIPYFEQAAEALDYLHSQNVSHRDVKPENLLILKGYAKVADFGLAREHEHHMTVVGAEVGTPLYMAPEVWTRKVSLHSDQYSLAATYIIARLGRPIFPAKMLHELCYQHLHETPDLAPLPPAEQAVLLKALAKKPEDRYPTCAAFAKALRAAVMPPELQPRRLAAWVLIAATLVVGISAGLVGKFLFADPLSIPPDVKPEPPAVPLWCPPGWAPVADAGTLKLDSGKEYHKRLGRVVAGEQLVALLVASPKPRPSDPPPFYMLENKVTNRVFKTVWAQAEADPNSLLSQFRRQHPDRAAARFPGKWKQGATDLYAKRLGIDGTQEDVPVVGVTLPEAMAVAAELGGLVPSYPQWLKAVGAKGDGSPPGPAGPNEAEGENLEDRPLALFLSEGPWPVARPTKDRSVFGVHQLVTNGTEWAAGNKTVTRYDFFDNPTVPPKPFYTGKTWFATRMVLTFDRMEGAPPTADWLTTEDMAGFRVVLTPE